MTRLHQLHEVGVDLRDAGEVLEHEGASSFAKSFTELLGVLDAKGAEVASD